MTCQRAPHAEGEPDPREALQAIVQLQSQLQDAGAVADGALAGRDAGHTRVHHCVHREARDGDAHLHAPVEQVHLAAPNGREQRGEGQRYRLHPLLATGGGARAFTGCRSRRPSNILATHAPAPTILTSGTLPTRQHPRRCGGTCVARARRTSWEACTCCSSSTTRIVHGDSPTLARAKLALASHASGLR
eukprot:scaffold2215_cov353-Prasinococcus_capsulatus_cf.AAC.3